MIKKEEGVELLQASLNDSSAQFRSNQWEAIDSLVNKGKRILVVERTGWGKSSIYFISAKLLREQGKGLTLIISPLLSLIRNQIQSAEILGLKAVTINSQNKKDWALDKKKILNNEVDVLLISPERLANKNFMEHILKSISAKIGLFVVDEAHCISDWGHDFRPDYRRIVNLLALLPQGMPVLATTATADDNVCDDIVSQLGDVEVFRGTLTRKSLILQNIKLEDQASRLAWLKDTLHKLPGSGIIYTLTKNDAQTVKKWLTTCGIKAAYYFSGATDEGFKNTNEYRIYAENALYNNDIKVLVATTALGMGYDKPDLGFVIHYQAPGSLMAYYQQVGRAGRAIDIAHGILLFGKEDEIINAYFREAAFPPVESIKALLAQLAQNGSQSVPQLMKALKLRKGQVAQVLKYLQVEKSSPIVKDKTKWSRIDVPFEFDTKKVQTLLDKRNEEWLDVKRYIDHTGCLMSYLQKKLGDSNNAPCGRCSACKAENKYPEEASLQSLNEARLFLETP